MPEGRRPANGGPAPPGVPNTQQEQGFNYEPEEFNREAHQPNDSPLEDVRELKRENELLKKVKEIPVKVWIIAAISVVLIVVLVIIISQVNKPKPVITPPEDVSSSSEEDDVWSMDTGDDWDPWGGDSTGSSDYGFFGDLGDASEAVTPSGPNSLTEEQKEVLRSYGFTGEQIVLFDNYPEFDYDVVVGKAKAMIQNRVVEEYNFLKQYSYDYSDPERRQIYDMSWFGLDMSPVTSMAPMDSEALTFASPKRENVTYKKVPLYGTQTWLQLTMFDGTIVFFNVPPQRYFELAKDEGNIVVDYQTIEINGVVWVTNITEVNINK